MYADLGLAVLRICVGVILLAHGLQKVGYLGGSSLAQTAAVWQSRLRFRPGWLWVSVVVLTEVVGGLLMIVGFLAFFAPFAIVGDMVVAAITVHLANGFWNAKGGIEFNLAVGAGALAAGLLGYGRWSVDALVGIAFPDWMMVGWAVLVALGVIAALVTREIGAGTTTA